MKKIGIITFHRAINYGAVLQAFALKNFLSNMGFDVQVIDYRFAKFEKQHSSDLLVEGKSSAQLISRILEIKKIRNKIKLFELFQQDCLACSTPSYTIQEVEEVCKSFDILVAGSDQVFDFMLTNKDPVFIEGFEFEGIRLSYAASMSSKVMSEENLEEFERVLSKFQTVSFREKSVAQDFANRVSKNICVRNDIDPVFLLTTDQWRDLTKDIQLKLPERYIVIYTVHKASDEFIKHAIKYAKGRGMEIVAINFFFSEKIKVMGKAIFLDCGPKEFVHVLKKAESIFTNSFHGTAFSINFNKSFLVESETQAGKNYRIAELLSLFNLQKQDVSLNDIANPEVTQEEWKQVNNIINTYNRNSRDYFEEYL